MLRIHVSVSMDQGLIMSERTSNPGSNQGNKVNKVHHNSPVKLNVIGLACWGDS